MKFGLNWKVFFPPLSLSTNNKTMSQLINESDQNSKNIWSIVAVVAITALVIGGGVYLQQKSAIENEKNEIAETVRGEFQQEIADLKVQLSQLKKTQEAAVIETPTNNENNEEVKLPESQESVVKPPINSMADWNTYQNEKYGFELVFPNRWKGYKITERNDTANRMDFNLMRTNGSYGSVFVIGVYSKGDWNMIQSLEGPKPNYLDENNKYIFGYSVGHDDSGFTGFPEIKPDEVYYGPYYDVKNKIIPTFKFTK